MSVIMSNNKTTQKKQAKPTRFEMVSYEGRNKMSFQNIERHLKMTELAEDNAYAKFSELKRYRQWTSRIHALKKRINQEKQILKEKK